MHFLGILPETHCFTTAVSIDLLHWVQLPDRVCWGLQMGNDQKLREPGPAANQGRAQTVEGKPKQQKPGEKTIKGMNFSGMWGCVKAWT